MHRHRARKTVRVVRIVRVEPTKEQLRTAAERRCTDFLIGLGSAIIAGWMMEGPRAVAHFAATLASLAK